jgi:phosphatidylserine/phosphatidylglycerophosphate/cardiolipin synthase-like enzyme
MNLILKYCVTFQLIFFHSFSWSFVDLGSVDLGSKDLDQKAKSTKKIAAYFNNDSRNFYIHPYTGRQKRGSDFEAIVIEEINKAQQSILVAIQEIRLPHFAQTLIAKKTQGVDIRIVLEDSYNRTLPEILNRSWDDHSNDSDQDDHEVTRVFDLVSFVDLNKDGILSEAELSTRDAVYMLRKAGIRIIDDRANGSMGSGLMHHKFLVIDHETLVATSANFTLSDIHGDYATAASTGNANALLVIRDDVIAETFAREFYYMWGGKNSRLTPRFGLQKPLRRTKKVRISDSSLLEVKFSPTSRTVPYLESTNGLIASHLAAAKREVVLGLFVFSEQRLLNALKYAYDSRPSLQVSALVERKFATRYYSELLDIWGIELLANDCLPFAENNLWPSSPNVEAGIARMNPGDILHHKFAVIDGEKVIFGSQNWSDSANTINDEFLLVINDLELAQEFRREYSRLRESGVMGPPSALLKRHESDKERCSTL